MGNLLRSEMQLSFYTSLAVAALSAMQARADDITAEEYLTLAQSYNNFNLADAQLLSQISAHHDIGGHGGHGKHEKTDLIAQLDADIALDNEAESELDSLSDSDDMSDDEFAQVGKHSLAHISSKAEADTDLEAELELDSEIESESGSDIDLDLDDDLGLAQTGHFHMHAQSEAESDLSSESMSSSASELGSSSDSESASDSTDDLAQVEHHGGVHFHAQNESESFSESEADDPDMLGPEYEFAQDDEYMENQEMLAQLGSYLATLNSDEVDLLENYMA